MRKNVIREFRLLMFTLVLRIAIWLLPKDAIKTLEWIINIPLEE